MMTGDAQAALATGHHSHPQCPRCGYALAGAIGWCEACPLEGRCSECGLAFLWRDVLNPRFNLPGWSAEHGSIAGLPWRAIRTLLKMLQPWRFWRELQMMHEPRWGRIAAFLLVLLPMWYVVLAMSAGMRTYDEASTRPGALPHPAWIYAIEATFKPWGGAAGTTSIPGRWVRAYEPLRIVQAGWRAVRLGFDRLPYCDPQHMIAERGFQCMLVILMCPAGFALLPVTRRITHVRWRHIFRIGLYSAMLLILPISLDCYDQIAGIRIRWRDEIGMALAVIVGLMLMAWWSCASRWYLRLRHPCAVGLAVVVLAYLSQRLILELIDLGLDLGG
jgi:hypothetical protein